MMLNHYIFFSCNCAYNDRLYAKVEHVWNFVCDGLASCATIHIEAVRKH